MALDRGEPIQVMSTVDLALTFLAEPLTLTGRVVESLPHPSAPPLPINVQLRVLTDVQPLCPEHRQLGIRIEDIGGNCGRTELQAPTPPPPTIEDTEVGRANLCGRQRLALPPLIEEGKKVLPTRLHALKNLPSCGQRFNILPGTVLL